MYKDDIKKIDDHIKNTVNTGYSMKDVQHLGGAAALKEELEKKCMGEACKFKNELAPIVAMINPEMTEMQIEMAEDRLHAMKQKIEMIQDSGQKAEAQKWLDKSMKELEKCEDGHKKSEKESKEHDMKKADSANASK